MNISQFNSSDLSSIENLLKRHYGLIAKAKKLVGYDDLNFYIKTNTGQEFILKIAAKETKKERLNMQNEAMLHLKNKKINLDLPSPIPNYNNEFTIEIRDENNSTRFMRLLCWVKGRLLAKVNPHSPMLLESLGRSCAIMCQNLADFDHPECHYNFRWDVAEASWIRPYLPLLQTVEQQNTARYFLSLFLERAQFQLPDLRKSVVHNDANDLNVLVNNDFAHPQVKGLIDFGDLIYTNTINDLAIAIAYAVMYKKDPLEAACYIVKGFHEVYPIKEAELAVLFSLIGARLLITTIFSAINRKKNPDNEYIFVSEKAAWDLMKKLKNIHPNFAHYCFRNVCGFEPFPKANAFKKWAVKHATAFFPIINFDKNKIKLLDLSVGSLMLGNNSNFENTKNFHKTIHRILEDAEASIGIGGYLETRPFYSTDAYMQMGNNGPKWRTVHLGVDIWMPAQTAVYAALDGKVFSAFNNVGERNYGPTLILQHDIDGGQRFYTLYGHLSLDSLNKWAMGMKIKKGQQIARIGAVPENGNWPPHLHFQIMLDTLGNFEDFPGVVFPDQTKVWQSICPDPNLILNLAILNNSFTSKEKRIIPQRKKLLGKSLSIAYQKPLKIVRGIQQYLYDDRGQCFLDTVNNVAQVGHEHPEVVKAGQKQMSVLNTNTRYLHEEILAFAEDLLATFPPELCVVHFVNSGSEANELALRMAKAFTQQKEMIVLEHGYHGNTNACIEISSYKFDGKGGSGAPDHVQVVPMPDIYRGFYKKNNINTTNNYTKFIQAAIDKIEAKGTGVAAFICESILSCGGQVVLPNGYLKSAYQMVRRAGGICIADEVQVGFGRVGEKFWGFDLQGVVPDIVTMGKPMGNGHPMAAVVCTREVADAFANGMEYFNTFGGNPVSCAIGRAVLSIIKKEELQKQAKHVGDYLKNKLIHLQKKYPIIGDVRGHGLFLGFELVRNQETLEAADKEATYLVNRMREHGVLMSMDGPLHNVIKIKPPLCFTKNNVDFLIKTLAQVLKEDFLKT